MARIPTAQDVRRVAPSSLPQIRVTDAAAGIDVYRAQGERGQVVNQVSRLLDQEATKLRDEEDTASAQLASSEYAKAVHRMNYGDPDAGTTGFFSLAGQAAMQARPDYEAKLEDEYKRVHEKLSKGAGRRFAQVGTARKLGAMEKSAAYVGRERQKFVEFAAKAEIQSITDELIADPHNAKKYLPNIDTAWRKLLHKQLGDPANASTPEKALELNRIIDSTILEATTKAHMGAIDTLLTSGSATAAADADAYFKEHKKGISAGKRDDVLKMLKDQTLMEKSQQATDEIMAAGGGWNAMHARAKKLSPEIRKEVRANLDRERTRQRLAKNDWEDAALAQATRAIQGGMSPAQFAKQNPEAFNGVAKHVESLWRMHDAGIQRDTYAQTSDRTTFRELARLPIGELRRLNVALHQHKLIKREADALYALQTQLDTTVEKTKTAPAVDNAGIAVLKSLAPGRHFSWDKSDEGTEKETDARNAEVYMTSLIQEHMAKETGKPTRKEYEVMALQSVRMFSSAPPNTQFFGMVPAEGERNIAPFPASDIETIKNLSEQQRDNLVAESLKEGVRNEKAYQLYKQKIREEPGVTYSDELMRRLLGATIIGNRKVIQQLLPVTSGYAPPKTEAPQVQQVVPGVTEQ